MIVMAVLVVNGCGYSDELHHRHTLMKLLWQERYAELDQAIAQAYVKKEKGKLSSNQLRTRIWQLQNVDPAFVPRFNNWVAHQDSSHAYLARGWFRLQQALNIRGDRPASEIPPEKHAKVRELMQLGADDMQQALSKDTRCAMCIGGKIFANMHLGLQDDDLIEMALLIDPTLFQPVDAHFVSLYPGWGGSETEMMKFIHHIGTLNGTEKTVQRLNAMFYVQRGLAKHFGSMDYAGALSEYETAISHSPNHFALEGAAKIYSLQGEHGKAAAALEMNLRENDEWDLYTIEALAQAYFAQDRNSDGKRMMKKRDELLQRFRKGE
jgi:tetratricopeptide (TPR) repeat protein